MFVAVSKILRIIVAISCSAERSFSGLQRMKSYLRSTMGKARLRSLAVLNIEREYSISCVSNNIDKVIDIFGSRKDRNSYKSEFSKFDNRTKHSGGSTSVQTHSWKNIVVTNRLFVNSDFEDKSETEQKVKWHWARSSKETKQVRKLEADCNCEGKKKKALVKTRN